MYLVYTDESGDPGLGGGGTPWFVISGIIIHESHLNEIFQRLRTLRQGLHQTYKIPQRISLHGTDIVNGHKDYHHSKYGLSTQDRFDIYHQCIDYLAQCNETRILNVFINKGLIHDPGLDVFEVAWSFFIQRFHNFLSAGGHLQLSEQYGMLITDRTQDDKLRNLLRKMRAYNYVPSRFGQSRQILVNHVVDDPVPRVSDHSYHIQMADLAAYSLARRDHPSSKLEKYNFSKTFDMLDPILLKQATEYDKQGIVYWPRNGQPPR